MQGWRRRIGLFGAQQDVDNFFVEREESVNISVRRLEVRFRVQE
jgi:hypothetical protein